MKVFNEEIAFQRDRTLFSIASFTSFGAFIGFLYFVFMPNDITKPLLVLLVFGSISLWTFYFLYRLVQKNKLKSQLFGTFLINLIFLLIAVYNPLNFTYMWVYLLYYPIIIGLIENKKAYIGWSILYIIFYTIFIFAENQGVSKETNSTKFNSFQIFLAMSSIIVGFLIVKHLEYLRRVKILEKQKQIKEHISSILSTLIPIVEVKTQSTKHEITEMSVLMKHIVKKIPGLDIKDWEIELLSLLHYVSKIQLPDYIFEKHEKLTEYENRIVQKHCLFGCELLGDFQMFAHVKDSFLKHHERINGTGYPLELKGSEVPILAQILGIVECYLAMVSPRAYRPAISIEDALYEIIESEQLRVDPMVLNALVEIIGVKRPSSNKEGKILMKYINAM